MKVDERHYYAKSILDSLRSTFGDSEFGYRMQALFAHVLLVVGALVKEVNAQGHPDIKAELQGYILNIQVKTAVHNRSTPDFILSSEDYRGVCSDNPHCKGYLAVLDCAEPVSWIVVSERNLKRLIGQPLHLASLRAECEIDFSDECTDTFLEILISNKEKLSSFTYRLLVKRVLSGLNL